MVLKRNSTKYLPLAVLVAAAVLAAVGMRAEVSCLEPGVGQRGRQWVWQSDPSAAAAAVFVSDCLYSFHRSIQASARQKIIITHKFHVRKSASKMPLNQS